jgi:hypothetical protein
MTDKGQTNAAEPCVLDRPVGRPEPERTCAQGCNGCDECTDYDEYEDWECDRCHGDGADPWTDYLMPCPACQGEQRP